MAFVFSEPRWIQSKHNTTPGPGSHSPELLLPKSANTQSLKAKHQIKKGKAFNTINKQNEIHNNNTQQLQKSPQLTSKVSQLDRNKINNSPKPKKNKTYITQTENKTKLLKQQTFLNYNHKILQPNTAFIQVNKLEPGIFLEMNKVVKSQEPLYSQYLLQKDQFIKQTDKDIMHKRLAPSIKSVSKQNFYIGSKDCQQKIPQDCIKNKISKKQKRIKLRSGNCLLSNSQQNSSQNNMNIKKYQQQLSILDKRKKKDKKINSKHPFHKNQEFIQENSKYDEKQTGIQDQYSEQMSQFITNAVPGPGSYQINRVQSKTKKSMMFTELNKPRFYKNDQQMDYKQIFYDKKPITSKGKSRASQRQIGFGRSLTKDYNSIQKAQNLPYTSKFYQNFNSIQNTCIKVKLKDALNPGSFTYKAPRFAKTPTKLTRTNIKQAITQQKQLQKIKQQYTQNRQNYQFISKVHRQTPIQKLTSNINYTGQQHKTIQKTITQLLSQQKYYQLHKQIQQIQPHVLKQHNKNKQNQLKRTKTQIQIKYKLVQDINGYRHRQDKILHKNQIKGYTFNNNFIYNQIKQNNPDPTKYYKQSNWFINSYNTNFMNQSNNTNACINIKQINSNFVNNNIRNKNKINNYQKHKYNNSSVNKQQNKQGYKQRQRLQFMEDQIIKIVSI